MSLGRKFINTLIGLSLLLLGWQALVMSGRYARYLLPSPWDVFSGMGELIYNGVLFTHITVSLYRFFTGYLIAVVVGITLGLIFGWFGKIWGIINPIVQILRPIAPIAWSPFIVLWFGIGDLPAIVIIFIAGFFPILLSTVSAVSKVDQVYLKVAKNFDIKQPQILTKIVLPAVFPYITSGLHIALGTCWIFLVAGEMMGTQSGLGFMIIDARNTLRSDLLLAGIIFIGLIGLLLDKGIQMFEKWVGKKWGIVPNERGQ